MSKINSVMFSFLLLLFASCNNKSFDSEKWKSWKENELTLPTRWDMTDDLMKNYLQKGMRIEDVETLIGRVSMDTIGSRLFGRYDLGPCRSRVDYGSLEVRFTECILTSVIRSCN